MENVFRIVPNQDDLMHDRFTEKNACSYAEALQANLAFDESVRTFLHQWIERGTLPNAPHSQDADHDAEDFINHGALRCFFRHRDDALEQLLTDEAIARHLLRPGDQVYFQPDGYEPLLASFEHRIYNLAAHREHLEIPFRYSSASRQNPYGDTVGAVDEATGQPREDIGTYFGTRRSDETALNILARQLQRETLHAVDLPVEVITDGYMDDSLRIVNERTAQLHAMGREDLHCFVIQRRHAADDRHLGAALLLMDPRQPDRPRRVIFCDTLNPEGTPPWWDKFKHKVDNAFPQPADVMPVSAMLEDGGVNLQRLHDGVPVRHQDIDCAFYTASMVRALIQLVIADPLLIVGGSIREIVGEMTARMPEYFEQAHQPRHPDLVREVNVLRRWNTGREALQNRMPALLAALPAAETYQAEVA